MRTRIGTLLRWGHAWRRRRNLDRPALDLVGLSVDGRGAVRPSGTGVGSPAHACTAASTTSPAQRLLLETLH